MAWCIPELPSVTGVGIPEYTGVSVCTCLGLELRSENSVCILGGLCELAQVSLYVNHLDLSPKGHLVQNLLLSGKPP